MIDPGPLPITSDFMRRMQFLSGEELGLLIRLLCVQWDAGSIPSDTGRLARTYGEEFTRSWPAIRMLFTRDQRMPTMRFDYFHGLREEAMRKRAATSEQRSRAARMRHGQQPDSGSNADAHAVAYPHAHADAQPDAHAPAHAPAPTDAPAAAPAAPARNTGTGTREGTHAHAGARSPVSLNPVLKSWKRERGKGTGKTFKPDRPLKERIDEFRELAIEWNTRQMIADGDTLEKFLLYFTQAMPTTKKEPDVLFLAETRMPFDITAQLKKWVLSERKAVGSASPKAALPQGKANHSREL